VNANIVPGSQEAEWRHPVAVTQSNTDEVFGSHACARRQSMSACWGHSGL